MKLISMTDFVLEQKKEKLPIGFEKHITIAFDFSTKCIKYAEFLKQPLKLEMFVPCNEDGNVLESPILSESTDLFLKQKRRYFEAKAKVLFVGFEFEEYWANFTIFHNQNRLVKLNLNKETIEDLIRYEPLKFELTESAIKQINP